MKSKLCRLNKIILTTATVLILSLIFNCTESTDQNEIQTFTSIYTNNTNASVKIINYSNGKKSERIILPTKSLLQENKILIDNIQDSIIHVSDSARVIFGNQKLSKFKKSDNSDFNILNGKNYITTFPSKSHTEQKYSFTLSDFNYAEICSGSCE